MNTQSIGGLILFILIALLVSSDRKSINIRQIISAFVLQVVFALIILKTTLGQSFFMGIASGFSCLYGFANKGTEFVFGNLAQAHGPWGFVFAIKVLPIMIFFAAFSAALYHIGLIQAIVKGISFFVRPVLLTTGPETLSVVANSFLGQTEAPLLIRRYLSVMTRSEIFAIMTSGMAHLSGAIMAAYGLIGVPMLHLLASSIIAIPGSIMMAKIMEPETVGIDETMREKELCHDAVNNDNLLAAIARGTTEGLSLALNVGAMLISFVSIMALLNSLFLWSTGFVLQDILGSILAPVSYLLGIASGECRQAGALLGQKIVINEFIAFSELVTSQLSSGSIIILTYAIAGFANVSSIGIQVAGIGALCPEKRALLSQLGFRALLAATLTNFFGAALISFLL